MSKTFRPYEPNQSFLMPASMWDWLPVDHLAYFISDIVDQLDLSAILVRYELEERGYPPYHPAMMVRVLLYAYCIGVPSSTRTAGKNTERPLDSGQDAAQVEDKEGERTLRAKERAAGASFRPDKAGERFQTIPFERKRQSER